MFYSTLSCACFYMIFEGLSPQPPVSDLKTVCEGFATGPLIYVFAADVNIHAECQTNNVVPRAIIPPQLLSIKFEKRLIG